MILENPRMKWAAFFLSTFTLSACTKPNPKSCADGLCTDQAYPFCDVDGTLGGEPKECIAVACSPNEFEACRGDKELRCNATGNNYDIASCDLGCGAETDGCRLCEPNQTQCTNGKVATCNDVGMVTSMTECPLGCFGTEPRCRRVNPSNGLAAILDMAATGPDLDYPSLFFDAGTGDIRLANGDGVFAPKMSIPNPGGPSMFAVGVKSAILHDVLISSSTGNRAFALVSAGDIRIVGGRVRAATGQPLTGCNAGEGRSNDASGGGAMLSSGSGGGGNVTVGGKGGDIVASFAGGTGGAPVGNDVLVPLQGGCGSGGVIFEGTASPSRVAGGGAMQLVSGTHIIVDGILDVRGGDGDFEAGPGMFVSYGGGAGGSILLEAPRVTLEANARLNAKGGGGGASGSLPPATDTANPNLGAPCISATCSSGGNGGAPGVSATAGGIVMRPGNVGDGIAGSGGGSIGRVRINTFDGTYQKSNTAIEAAAVTTGVLQTR